MNKLKIAAEFVLERGHPVPLDVMAVVYGRSFKQAFAYQNVRNTFWAKVYDAVYDFLSRPIARTGPETRMRIALSEAYDDAANIGYEDGGGTLPLDEDSAAYLSNEKARNLSYTDDLFTRLLALRKDGDVNVIQESFKVADRWASALDGHYNYFRMAGAKNKMLTWRLGGTIEHCKDCSKLDGQRHRASWYRRRDFIPRKAGAAMECRGFRCACGLEDDNGNEMTI